MLNIFGYKANENQNYIDIPYRPSQNGYYQYHKQQQMLVRIWGKRSISTLFTGMGVQSVWRAIWRLSKN
jgi:hypothetical protein